jgi:GDPmannose 4,6-dehydratase
MPFIIFPGYFGGNIKLENKFLNPHVFQKLGPLELGNLDAKRDWSHSKDMCHGIWLMLQQEKPENFVLASEQTHSVREFVELAFKEINIDIVWRGTGVDEIGIKKGTEDDQDPHVIVKVNPKYFRDIDIECLIGDASKAKRILGWEPTISFSQLVSEMVTTSIEHS